MCRNQSLLKSRKKKFFSLLPFLRTFLKNNTQSKKSVNKFCTLMREEMKKEGKNAREY